ncbi:MAG: hypothetical protein LUE27_03930 [Clostridia bacterium]|nr:hypothetical protein [Clostridia bacterium]
MKKYALLTTLLASAVIAASVVPGIAAFADNAEDTFYPVAVPKELTFENLTGYAIEGQNSIFADGETIIILQGDTITYSPETSPIGAVDVYEGVFYKQLEISGESVSYAYSDGAWVEETGDAHDYSPRDYTDLGDGYTYIPIVYTTDKRYSYRTSEDGLTIADLESGTDSSTDLAGFTLLTYYDSAVYAVKDNVIYTFEGEEYTEMVFEYFQDEDETSTILVGTSMEKIAATEWSSLQKVTLKASTDEVPVYMTEISLNEFKTDSSTGKTYFIPGITFEVTNRSVLKAGDDVLLLCAVGNAYIVSSGTQAYIMAQTGGETADIEVVEMTDTATAVEVFGAYYVPFISNKTESFEIQVPSAENNEITYPIVGMISEDTYPFLAHDFYVIQKSASAEEYAFVPTGCLTLYTYTPENPGTTSDPDESYENLIEKVVLTILLVMIILAIIGYLVFVATGHKYRNAKDGSNPTDKNDEGGDQKGL